MPAWFNQSQTPPSATCKLVFQCLYKICFILCFIWVQPVNCAALRLTRWSCNLVNVIMSSFEMHTSRCCCLLSLRSVCLYSVAPASQQHADVVTCTGSTKGQACSNRALPFTQHCFQRILSPCHCLDSLYLWRQKNDCDLISVKLSCTLFFKCLCVRWSRVPCQ